MSAAIPVLPLHALMVCTGKTVPLPLLQFTVTNFHCTQSKVEQNPFKCSLGKQYT